MLTYKKVKNRRIKSVKSVELEPPKFDGVLGVFIYKFPAKANTFVVNELIQLRKRGIKFKIYSLAETTSEDTEAFKDVLDSLGKITYIQSEKLFRWKWADENQLPIANNRTRKAINNLGLEECVAFEERSIRESFPVFEELIGRMKEDGITKLYSPFASVGADFCMMISHHTGIPYYFECHSYDLFTMDFIKPKLDTVSGVFSISEYNKKYMVDELGCDPEKIKIKRVNFISDDKGIEPPDVPYDYVFSAGRLCEMKAFHNAINAFAKFHILHPDVHYIIAGDGGKYEELVELVTELNLEDYVHFMGHVDNAKVIAYIKGCKFSMLTSITSQGDREGIPTFFIESMNQGTPCIGTDYSGIPELIEDGVNGYLAGENDINYISECMHELYIRICDINSCDAIRGECIDKVSVMFDNDINIDVLVEGFGV